MQNLSNDLWIRPYQRGDRQGIVKLLQFLPALYPFSADWLDQRLDDFEAGRAYCSVGGKGAYLKAILIDTPKGHRRAKISTLYVDPIVGDLGLGSRLYNAHLGRWRRQDVNSINITVAESRLPAIESFLLERNFVRGATEIDRYGPGRNEVTFVTQVQ